VVYCNSRTHRRAVIRNGGSPGNAKFQSSNPNETPSFKYPNPTRSVLTSCCEIANSIFVLGLCYLELSAQAMVEHFV
jgi:hypothetical protein